MAAKKQRLTELDIGLFIIQRGIRDFASLLAAANERFQAGERDLAKFIFRIHEKRAGELIELAWKFHTAPDDTLRAGKTRVELLHEAGAQPCSCPDSGFVAGKWLQNAKQTLNNNLIEPDEFGAAILDLLTHGRSKYRNIIVHGPSNCGKTFLLDPLTKIYRAFSNPATNSKFAWIDSDKRELIFLNDFRWTPEVIGWETLLLLLEGQLVNLPTPKNSYPRDIVITAEMDTPIFCTSKGPIRYTAAYNQTCEKENRMMDLRWKQFKLFYEMGESDTEQVPSCCRCFFELVTGSELDANLSQR